jgi:hypothetical protein
LRAIAITTLSAQHECVGLVALPPVRRKRKVIKLTKKERLTKKKTGKTRKPAKG